jgi:hypothetical protein
MARQWSNPPTRSNFHSEGWFRGRGRLYRAVVQANTNLKISIWGKKLTNGWHQAGLVESASADMGVSKGLLNAAGIASYVDPGRGLDHGVFVPMKVAFPQYSGHLRAHLGQDASAAPKVGNDRINGCHNNYSKPDTIS